ncbi:MAG: hypothetical protein NTX75_02645, partial [Proteobacteria bacterium]|nr:hypothetical protein [Pseudomonadota bacterium]
MLLTSSQQQVLNTIIQVGTQRGLTTEQIIRVASVAELESTLRPDCPDNRWGAGGLFQYKDETWNGSRFQGSKFNAQDATNAFITDMLKYEKEYNLSSNDVEQRIARMEKKGIEGTLENYICYRHNRDLGETEKMADKLAFDPEGRFNEIGTYIEPNYVPGPNNPSNHYGLLPSNDLSGLPDMMNTCRNLFNTATVTPSPIILDLDGDGVETTNFKDGAYFDHDG